MSQSAALPPGRDGVDRDRLVAFLDKLLPSSNYPLDSCYNGLQVVGGPDVQRVAFGLDASLQLFESVGPCQMIVAHHGLIWSPIRRIDEPLGRRLRLLLERGISLYCSHLPLHGSAEVGNAATLLRAIGLKPRVPILDETQIIGWTAEYPASLPLAEVIERIRRNVSPEFQCLSFGPPRIRRVGAVTGAGARLVGLAPRLGLDLFISGEPSHPTYHLCREEGLNLVTAGHYRTEVLGLRALMERVSTNFPQLETAFVDLPTGL